MSSSPTPENNVKNFTDTIQPADCAGGFLLVMLLKKG